MDITNLLDILYQICNTLFFTAMPVSCFIFTVILIRGFAVDNTVTLATVALIASIVIYAFEIPYAISVRWFGVPPLPYHQYIVPLEDIPIIYTWVNILRAAGQVLARNKIQD